MLHVLGVGCWCRLCLCSARDSRREPKSKGTFVFFVCCAVDSSKWPLVRASRFKSQQSAVWFFCRFSSFGVFSRDARPLLCVPHSAADQYLYTRPLLCRKFERKKKKKKRVAHNIRHSAQIQTPTTIKKNRTDSIVRCPLAPSLTAILPVSFWLNKKKVSKVQ